MENEIKDLVQALRNLDVAQANYEGWPGRFEKESVDKATAAFGLALSKLIDRRVTERLQQIALQNSI